jgi:hypothetical protein
LKFVYKKNDDQHVEKLLKIFNSIKRLMNELIYNQFDRVMYSRIEMKIGKSIFNTKYTETISQHFPMSIK